MPVLTSSRLFSAVRRNLAALLFTPHCSACGVLLESGPAGPATTFCQLCTRSLTSDLADCCHCCGAHSPHSGLRERSETKSCRYCRGSRFPVRACCALGNYGDLLQKLIVQMKGNRNELLALQLGRLLGQRLRELPWSRELEAIVPVPVHWSKQLQKGFHGAAVISEGIRRELGLPWLPKAVSSTRRTAKQGMLEPTERFRNVAGAFLVADDSKIRNRTLLLVDDVLTSGATLTAVASASLRQLSVKRDLAVTISPKTTRSAGA